MQCNVGKADRTLRILVGLGLLASTFFLTLGETLNLVFYVVAAVLLLTALVKFCPAYKLLGVKSCSPPKN